MKKTSPIEAEVSSVDEFYKITGSLPPSKDLVEAVQNFFVDSGTALDLGCGAGRDTNYLLEQGFTVTAVDIEAKAGESIRRIKNTERLTFVNVPFDQYPFQPNQFDLVNARFSLPFNPKSTFPAMFQALAQSIKTGGIFVGQLFGVNDEWNVAGKDMTFHTEEEIRQLFAEFDIIKIEETDRDDRLANGTPKHWHYFDIIARKKELQ